MTKRQPLWDVLIILAWHFVQILAGIVMILSLYLFIVGVPLAAGSIWALQSTWHIARYPSTPPGRTLLNVITAEILVVTFVAIGLTTVAGLGPHNNKISLVGVTAVVLSLTIARVRFGRRVSYQPAPPILTPDR